MKNPYTIDDPDVKLMYQLFFILLLFCCISFIGLNANINELETKIKQIELENRITRNSCK
jgi:hypothetical protein